MIPGLRSTVYHLKTLYLFTKSDFKTIIFPVVRSPSPAVQLRFTEDLTYRCALLLLFRNSFHRFDSFVRSRGLGLYFFNFASLIRHRQNRLWRIEQISHGVRSLPHEYHWNKRETCDGALLPSAWPSRFIPTT